MKLVTRHSAAICFLLGFFFRAGAEETLSQLTQSVEGWSSSLPTTTVQFGLPGTGSSKSFSSSIFDEIHLTSDDVGRLWRVAQTDDPDFGILAAALTNGEPDYFRVYLRSGAGTAKTALEAELFGLPSGGNKIDFEAFEITSISLRLDYYLWDPSIPPVTTNHRVDVSILIGGVPVPEPAAGTLVLFAVFVLFLWRKTATVRCKSASDGFR